MLLQKPEEIKRRALRLSRKLRSLEGFEIRLVRDVSRCGGGALPELSLETYCLGLRHKGLSPVELEKKLRNSDPPIVARIKDDMVLLDMRTVEDRDLTYILKALKLLEV